MVTLRLGANPSHREDPTSPPTLIALTGGPGAGKTAVLEMASRALSDQVALLPEAASLVFGGGFPRHDSLAGRQASQRAIYRIQRELEELVLQERKVRFALCDRGTVDSLAYWPGPLDEFFDQVGSTHEAELTRYAAVLHLRTPGADSGYNHQNALRIETPDEALRIDERILEVWEGHPNRVVIPSSRGFLEKASLALNQLSEWLEA